ncbi:hypothetical protein MPSI1_001599 [Malassezia psittaci]|uniref:Helicase C-terminal domain-containing protein n=1 Tax=Malassezia psittaci TaxID=1821823 RepID=A0AAF0F548_9BASI|nr:hypothetical protein MPSI1_001599 [Malassezia psittaci]
MGVGKTIICLALILETLSQVSRPAQEPMASATTSELALTFPDPEYCGKDPAEALAVDRVVTAAFGAPSPGERISRIRKSASEPEVSHESHATSSLRVSLTQITIHRIRTTIGVPPLETLPPQLRTLLGPVSAPFIHLWPPPPARLSRISQGRTPTRVYLTAATLVLVPRTLLVQWVEEIDKHILPGALRVHCVSDMHTPLPDALTLSQSYDIVLMSHARFGKEAGDDCQGMRSNLDTSPIMQVYWKRVMIDEGNILAGDSLIVRLCSHLRVERRWIVTGTPTEALVGSSLRAAGRSVSAPHVVSSSWTAAERKSLDRLKLLLVRFLRLAPFAGATAALASAARASGLPSGKERDWNQLMGTSKESRTNYTAKYRLYDILSRVMVRNRVEDVEKECPLPPLHHRTIYLTPSKLERKTYNVLQALIVLNAALSQESDKDYFFHASNRKSLASVMENLSLACFHFAGKGFEEQTRNARELIQSQHDSLPSRYKESIQQAVFHLDEALDDPSWHAHIASSDVMYSVNNADPDIVRAWAGSHATFLTADDLVQLRRAIAWVQRNTHMDPEELREEVITKGALYLRRKHGKAADHRSASSKASPSKTSEVSTASSSHPRARNAVDSRGRMRGFWEDLVELPEDMNNALIVKSSSTKLNAIMQEIFQSAADEKILLFSMQENVLFEIAAALDVAQVPYLCYVAGMPQRIRNEYASTFTHQSTYRCLLMSTSVGGRGLDLHCASRVIFTEPVWQMDLESQAVKRAWRMGQTRQVVVSTYVMRETFEEQILERKNHRMQATSLEQENNVRTMTDDPGMRSFVAHPKFVPSLPCKDELWHLWLFQTQRPWLFSPRKRVKLS